MVNEYIYIICYIFFIYKIFFLFFIRIIYEFGFLIYLFKKIYYIPFIIAKNDI